MIIHSMSANFGCLEGRTLELKEGLNIIHAPNETGKSTWCAFLAAMLYGLNTRERSRPGRVSEKERYLPWSGGTMLGRLECSADGKDLTLLRTTRRTGAPMAEFRALYTGTGTIVPGLTGENCGEMLLGVGREVFRRSAFIRQSGLAITQDPELERRIAALISTGEDGGAAATEALEALRHQLNRRRHNKTGQLPALEAQLRETEETLLRTEALARAWAEGSKAVEELEQHREALLRELEHHRLWDSMEKHLTAEEARAAAETAAEEYALILAALEKDHIPENDTIARLRGAIVNLAATAKNVEKARQQRDEAAKALLRAEAAANESPFAGKTPEQAAREAAGTLPVPSAKWKELAAFLFCLAVSAGVTAVFIMKTSLLDGLWTYLPWAVFAGLNAVGLGIARMVGRHDAQRTRARILTKRFGTADKAAIIAMAEEYARLYESLEHARAEAERCSAAAEGLHSALTSNEQAILLEIRRFAPHAFDLSAADALLRQCGQRRKALADAQSAKREAQLRLDILLGLSPAPAVMDGVSKPLRSRESAEAELRRTEAELLDRRGEKDRLAGQLHAAGDTDVLRQKAAQLQEQIAGLEEEYEAIRLAMETLEEADTEMQNRFSPLLGRKTGEIFSTLTGGEHSSAALSRDLQLSAQPKGDSQLREISLLSAGTADQLYLAARLALCGTVLPAEKKAPLILDDALVNFDDERCAAALRWLKEEAKNRQVILFSCHSREADFFAADTEVFIQRLTNEEEKV